VLRQTLHSNRLRVLRLRNCHSGFGLAAPEVIQKYVADPYPKTERQFNVSFIATFNFDPIVGSMHQVLLGTEVALRGLHRCMAKQQLDLL
jgi:hypothetical protein